MTPGEIIVVYTPGGGHLFYEELVATRNGPPATGHPNERSLQRSSRSTPCRCSGRH